MRGLYWLTALTLVAAAVITVAIADYGRRHPGAFFWQNGASQTETSTKLAVATACCEQCPAQPETVVQIDSLPQLPASAIPCENPGLTQAAPAPPMVPPEPPEHRELRENTLRQLSMMQPAAVALTPSPQPTTPDEFSFPGDHPILPAVPQPTPGSEFAVQTERTEKCVASSLAKVEEFSARGAEVLPGLNVAKSCKQEDLEGNLVRECLWGCAELITQAGLPSHLTGLPMRPKAVGVAEVKLDECCATVGKKTCCAQQALDAAARSANAGEECQGDCGKTTVAMKGSCCEEVMVRTYPIAEFVHEKTAQPDELIRLITTMVAPETWSTRDSNIEYFPAGKCLVVRHRGTVQTQVSDLLTQLRSAVQTQNGMNLSVSALTSPGPVICFEKSVRVPLSCELVMSPPQESPLRLPRVFTDEPMTAFDDEFFGLAPVRADGRLMPVPTVSRISDSALLPAGFTPSAEPIPGCFEDGPVNKAMEKRVPDFFPMYLPFTPVPAGPESGKTGNETKRNRD